MLQYPLFYRKHGVRKRGQMISPPLSPINTLILPRSSVLHYLADGPNDFGVTADDPLVVGMTKIVMVDHVFDLRGDKGPPRPKPALGASMRREYHRKNRKMRPLRKMETALRDERMLIVINYAILPHLYRYVNNIFVDYYRWYNIRATLWDKVNEMAKQTNRHQFIPMKLPKQLPGIQQLRRGENGMTRTVMDFFPDDESMDLLDLWIWLGDNRPNSLMSKIEPEQFSKINLLFMESGRFVVVNLGQLTEWRAKGENDVLAEGDEGDGAFAPFMFQKLTVKLLMVLFEAGTVGAGQATIDEFEEEGEQEEKEEQEQKEAGSDDDDDEEESDSEVPVVIEKPVEDKTLPAKIDNKHLKDAAEGEDTFSDDDTVDDEIDPVKAMNDVDELDAMLENLNKRAEIQQQATGYTPPDDTLEKGVDEVTERMVDAGLLSAAEYRRMKKMAARYKEIKNPVGEGTLEDLLVIPEESLKVENENKLVEELPGVLDKSMLSNSVEKMDRKYIKTMYHKDIANAVVGIQKAGVAVQNYNVERVDEYLNSYEIHTVKVVPVVGAPSTVRFRVPVIEEDGTFIANGVRQHLRKQRGDMPIRKTSPVEVALTSYYGKMFVQRSERAVHNYERWLTNQITSKGLDVEDTTVTELRFANVFDPQYRVPHVYSMLAKSFSSFISNKYFFYFNFKKRMERFGIDRVEKAEFKSSQENHNLIVCGTKGKEAMLLMDPNGNLYSHVPGKPLVEEGIIETILGISPEKRPLEILEVGFFGKSIPLGFVLAYEVGLNNLIKHLKVEPRRVGRGQRLNLSDDEWAVRFEDESLVFDRSNKVAEYLFGGFNRYHRDIRRYSLYDFDKKDIYQVVLDRNGLGARYVREMDLVYKMFIDHITKDLLIEMKEPTNMVDLLIRAAELLVTDDHPHGSDMAFMRDKGYERVAGMIYAEMVRGMRAYKAKPATPNTTFDVNPQAVWQTILHDPAGKPIEESNPIANMKQKEIVIYAGEGGRNKRSMTAKHRQYHRSNIGSTSESTPDSGDVGTIIYTTADPKYTSLRGTTAGYNSETDGPARLVSPSMLISPAADKDDPKRVNFIQIQHSQTVSSVGNTPSPLRTGYERVMAHRVDDLYASTAQQKGKVVEVTDKHVIVEYKDGTRKTVELGRRFGSFAGAVIPHELVCDLKSGQTVSEGDVIAYNSSFFQRDRLDSKQVLWKAGVMAKVAFMESPDTFEDSSAISTNLAEKLTSDMSKIRIIRAGFEQEIRNMVKVGDVVDIESILCTIENPVGGGGSLFDEESLNTLKAVSSLTPKAKTIGRVERVEVLYNGDKDDMSDSLKKITSQSDRDISQRAEVAGKPKTNGRVDGTYRIENRSLDPDSLAIKVYITGPVSAGVGDKGVFASQMKTVFGRVMTGINRTESGDDIDAIFGYRSLTNRIVLSPIIMGTTNTLLRIIGQKAVAAYRGKDAS